jgi:hypothetical protein
MDLDLLEQALTNDDNLSIINTNIQEIKAKKNDLLQSIGIKKDDLKLYHKKLKNYRYIDDLNDLICGSVLRLIKLKNTDPLKLHNTVVFCGFNKLKDNNVPPEKKVGLLVRSTVNKFFVVYFYENLVFQKINDEEQILLKAINHLNKA